MWNIHEHLQFLYFTTNSYILSITNYCSNDVFIFIIKFGVNFLPVALQDLTVRFRSVTSPPPE